jgi:hypothetical protein
VRSSKGTRRTIGMMLLAQLAGLIVPFVLLLPLTTVPVDYLANAARAAFQIKAGVFLLFANCALTIGISITALRIIRPHSEAAALWLVAVSVIMFLLQSVDNIHVLSMLSLSQQYNQAGDHDELFLKLAAVVGSTRRWAHLTELLVIDGWILLFYSVLLRFALVPRAVAVFGLVTVLLHFIGIPLRGFAGYGGVAVMGMPMALSHITLATWLIAKGVDERHGPLRAEPEVLNQ